MNAEAPLRRILGRIFSVAIILAAVLLAWAVGVDLRNNPRTEDAQVRANVIGWLRRSAEPLRRSTWWTIKRFGEGIS